MPSNALQCALHVWLQVPVERGKAVSLKTLMAEDTPFRRRVERDAMVSAVYSGAVVRCIAVLYAVHRSAVHSGAVLLQCVELGQLLEGTNRSFGVHAAGIIISPACFPLSQVVPVQHAPGNPSALVSQYAMDDVERLGLLKFDILGLRNLTTAHLARLLAQRTYGVTLPVIEKLPVENRATFELLSGGDVDGVFQLEASPGMKKVVRALKPSCLADIFAIVALYRPGSGGSLHQQETRPGGTPWGRRTSPPPFAPSPPAPPPAPPTSPLDAGLVDRYINRKHGREPVSFQTPALEPILKETYGVLLYQEQIMRMARDLAGYSLGQADMLRRAMGKKKQEEMVAHHERFVEGAVERGVERAVAEDLFEQMVKFSQYCFNKSHSAAYGYLTYVTAFLKANYPLPYMAALLSTSMLEPPTLRRYVSLSGPATSAADGGIRFGLAGIRDVSRAAAEEIIGKREAGGRREEKQREKAAKELQRQQERQAREEKKERERVERERKREQQRIEREQKKLLQGKGRGSKQEGAVVLEAAAGVDPSSASNGAVFTTSPPPATTPSLTSTTTTAIPAFITPPPPPLPPSVTAALILRRPLQEEEMVERLAQEKALLGFYVTQHPVEALLPSLPTLLSLTPLASCAHVGLTKSLEDSAAAAAAAAARGGGRRGKAGGGRGKGGKDGPSVAVVAMVEAVNVRMTKNSNKQMANLQLDDGTGQLEAVVFPDVFARYGSSLSKGATVLAWCTVDVEFEDTQPAAAGSGDSSSSSSSSSKGEGSADGATGQESLSSSAAAGAESDAEAQDDTSPGHTLPLAPPSLNRLQLIVQAAVPTITAQFVRIDVTEEEAGDLEHVHALRSTIQQVRRDADNRHEARVMQQDVQRDVEPQVQHWVRKQRAGAAGAVPVVFRVWPHTDAMPREIVAKKGSTPYGEWAGEGWGGSGWGGGKREGEELRGERESRKPKHLIRSDEVFFVEDAERAVEELGYAGYRARVVPILSHECWEKRREEGLCGYDEQLVE
ncbi:unnamed protein product [Closterium sp. Naga37s-1]|nr:unnamed protein product [Closterium sp. Naga37s-1]